MHNTLVSRRINGDCLLGIHTHIHVHVHDVRHHGVPLDKNMTFVLSM